MKFSFFFHSICFALTLFVIIGCADRKADFEKAEYYIGKGGATAGAKAASLMTPYLTSPDIGIRIRAHRLYAGAKIAEAGFDIPRIVSKIVERDSSNNNGLAVLKDAFTGVVAETAKSNLIEAISKIQTLQADSDFAAVNLTDSGELAFREKQNLYFSAGISSFLYALVIGSRETTLVGDSDFNASDCEDAVRTDDVNYEDTLLNVFVQRLRVARVHFVNSGLSDVELKAQVIASPESGDVGNSELDVTLASADSRNNSVNDIVQDIQAEVDGDIDGVPGSGGGFTPEEFCDYIESQNS